MPISPEAERALGPLGRVVQYWARALSKQVEDTDSDKADKVVGAVAGHFAGLNASGNLVDSGQKDSDYADAVHAHDDRYYTEAEVAALFAALATVYAAFTHAHDDRYYTETQSDARFEPIVTPVAYQATPTVTTLRDAMITLGFMNAPVVPQASADDVHFDTAGDEHFDTEGDQHFDNQG